MVGAGFIIACVQQERSAKDVCRWDALKLSWTSLAAMKCQCIHSSSPRMHFLTHACTHIRSDPVITHQHFQPLKL